MIKLLLFLLSFNVLAFDIVDPVFDMEEMEHENKGCPLNSICSKESGEKRLEFIKLVKKLNSNPKDKIYQLTKFLETNGLPLLFLAEKDSYEKLDPIMWTSSCKFHNPKNPNNAIMKAEKFLKEVKQVDDMSFTPLRVYLQKSELNFYIPYQSSLIMLDGEKIITLNDYEDLFYQLAISENGKIQIKNYSSNVINNALSKKISEVKCPKDMSIDEDFFRKPYCAKIWDIKSKKLKTIQFGWACP